MADTFVCADGTVYTSILLLMQAGELTTDGSIVKIVESDYMVNTYITKMWVANRVRDGKLVETLEYEDRQRRSLKGLLMVSGADMLIKSWDNATLETYTSVFVTG